MLQNHLATALRNLAHNKLHSAINIAGLAVGLTATLLIALFVRHELSYDRFGPDHARTYLLASTLTPNGREPAESHQVPGDFARWLEAEVPGVETAVRVSKQTGTFRNGAVATEDEYAFTDPAVLDLLSLKAHRGNPHEALKAPQSVVLTRSMARKYFGTEDPIGRTLEMKTSNNLGASLKVTGVLEDLPTNTHLSIQIFVSGNTPFDGGLGTFDPRADRILNSPNSWSAREYVYFRVRQGVSIAALERSFPQVVQRHRSDLLARGDAASLHPVPLASIHLRPENTASSMRPTSSPNTLRALAGLGLAILLVACINFVNLMTAYATRRATEVGIRKVCGATRGNLIRQFIGEALIVTTLAMIAAIALTELLMNPLNAFLDRQIVFDYLHQPVLLAAIAGCSFLIGVLTGLYPAFVLSSFRPSGILRGPVKQGGSARVRQLLVVLQFAVLIGLVVGTVAIHRQTQYMLQRDLTVDGEQMLLVEGCTFRFKNAVERLPGVEASACAYGKPLNPVFREVMPFLSSFKRDVALAASSIGFDYLEVYGLRPLAGRFFSRRYGLDIHRLTPSSDTPIFSPGINQEKVAVLNESAARALGFASPGAAVGQTFSQQLAPEIIEGFLGKSGYASPQDVQSKLSSRIEIIGVAPDFLLDAVSTRAPPMVYFVAWEDLQGDMPDAWMSIKLAGARIPETLAAIDAAWKRTGQPGPIHRVFLSQALEDLYRDIRRQSALLTILSGIALCIAALGLFTLSAFATRQRLLEISVRKALGAGRGAIARLLLTGFSMPVLLANLIAWPAGYYFISRWLEQFAYRIDMAAWMFVMAGTTALTIALLTVSAHTLAAARTPPVEGLRGR